MTNFTLTKRVAYFVHTCGTCTCGSLCPDLCPLSACCIDERLRGVRKSRYQDLHNNCACAPSSTSRNLSFLKLSVFT